MIENKSLGSKFFDILNVVILIAITLICIVPVWYVLCVSLSSREAVNAGQVLSGRLASTCSPIRRSWERPHSSVPFWYLLKGFYWEQESVWYVSLWQHFRYPERKSSSRREISLCGSSYSACYSTEVRFRGISP